MERHGPGTTHDVTNQVPPLADYNLFASDTALVAALERDGAAWHREALLRDGAALTTPETLALAEVANVQPARRAH
jgi:putative acyl-CoA dehydrogenase